ncbi:gliding motility-associated-like protein [Mucilaginibacter yixingensis]|uniref:Gliding motility-associated-like protein n=1 Tax=Mucilaginibacter yixingensis TaxID=1295612 RepID=A0A2T5JCN2_9SPHI|nr:gliding motility-associated C-terminal domain-containing protein [Mucilaginibacter yixingensis]PTQ99514.1 gliding motility-associated-like protein [Mucilaginibacter yixingensis]
MRICLLFILSIIFLMCCPVARAQDQTVVNGTRVENVTFPGTQCSYKWTNDKPEIGLPATGTGNLPAFTATNNTNSPIVATITATPMVSGMAYITNNYINTVSVIDLATNQIVTTFGVGKVPVGAYVNPSNNQIYIANSYGGSVSVVNTLTNTVKTTIAVGSYPFSVYVTPDGSRAYVPNYNDGNISVINTSTNTVVGKYAAGINPLFVTSSADGSVLYVMNDDYEKNGPGSITVLNANTGAKITNITVDRLPWYIITSPDGKLVYVSNTGSGSISVISTNSNTVIATIPVGYGPRNLALSPDGALLYVRSATVNQLKIINTISYATVATIDLTGIGSAGLDVSPDGKRVVLTNPLSNTVTIIDAELNKIIADVSVPGDEPFGAGNFILGGNNCAPATFKITVNPSPGVSAVGSLSALSTIYGSASATTSITVSGTWLTSALTITAPDGFEISNDGVNYNKVLTINANAGTINSTPVYLRLTSATPVGSYTGNLIMSGNNLADVKIPILASEVKPATLTVQADDKDKIYGTANPTLTATYRGFVNNEGITQLTTLANITTPADISSPVGQYPITASNASAANYAFKYIDGTLTIVPNAGVVEIPNTFTPNGDGVNDTWMIKNINTFTTSTVSVFNRYGIQVFFSKGYPSPWNGHYNNQELPSGVYYYIIKTDPKEKPFTGHLTIIR